MFKTLDIIGEIDELTIQKVSDFILELSEEDEYILINISSRGGEIEALLAIIDILEGLDIDIVTNVNGYCYSSALPLYLIGDVRICGNKALFMYHKCSYGIDGKVINHKQQLELSYKMQKVFDKYITARTNITQNQLEKYKYNEWYFDKDEALKLGVVHS